MSPPQRQRFELPTATEGDMGLKMVNLDAFESDGAMLNVFDRAIGY